MTNQPDKNPASPAIISFKKFLVAYHNGDGEAITEALKELNSYSEQEIKELGQSLEGILDEALAAEQSGSIDALSEKYAAEVETAVKENKNEEI